MWSCVVLVRPSRRRLMDRRARPYREDPLFADSAFFLLEVGWWRVNVATPRVTRRTTPYL